MAVRHNESVQRAFQILRALPGDAAGLTATELAQRLGLSLATTHRFLVTLEALGAVMRDQSNRFHPGLLLAELGGRVEQDRTLAQGVQPIVDRLVANLNETVHVGVLVGGRVRYVAKGESSRSLKIDTHVGKLLPAHSSALGKVLLADRPAPEIDALLADAPLTRFTARTITDAAALRTELGRVARQGYAMDDEESEEGLRCLAVPIRDRGGRVGAAISTSGPAGRLDDARLSTCRVELMAAANAIAARLFGLTAAA